MRPARLLLAFVLTALAPPPDARAQDAPPGDTLGRVLPEIRVEAVRGGATDDAVPFAVSRLIRPAEAAALDPAVSLAGVLRAVPGVWLADRGHFALGERLTVRGMGWRSAFGVRGVQVLLDGVPLTMPDGQAVIEVVDPLFLRRAEVLRGPASLFWGNAAGGALLLSTGDGASAPFARARALGGSYGLVQRGLEAGTPLGRHRVGLWGSDVRQDGYRDYSAGRLTRGGARADVALGARTRLRLTAAAVSQDTEHPGALTRDELRSDRRGADARYVATASGKRSTQTQAGVTLLRATRAGLVTATLYGIRRDLDNPLPFAYIDLARRAGGARVVMESRAGRIRWRAGLDGAAQRDDRFNYDNDGGRPAGAAELDQRERVATAAAFAVLTVPIGDALAATGGLRLDRIRFTLEDRLPADGDDGGRRAFTALSPAVGIAYRGSDVTAFANYSTAFETPTTTELVNRPDGARGLNDRVGPQRTRGPELGLRARRGRGALDLAVYRYRVTGGLLPFQDDEGRTYYRNAGTHLHAGAEAAGAWTRGRLDARLAYTFTHLRFSDGGGRALPGVPPHRIVAEAGTAVGGLQLHVEAEGVSAYWADDENTARVGGHAVLNLRLGHRGPSWRGLRVKPFAEMGDVFDRRPVGSVTVNARGGRYYEPAPGRTIRAGLTAEFFSMPPR